MNVLESPPPDLQDMLDELEYEPMPVHIPGLPGDVLKILAIDELPLEVLACLEACQAEISGRRIWPGSAILSSWLCHSASPCPKPPQDEEQQQGAAPDDVLSLAGKRVVELGCGSGLSSMVAARLGATHVVATDGDQKSIELAVENMQENGFAVTEAGATGSEGGPDAPCCVSAQRLLWGAEHLDGFMERNSMLGGADVILAGDVLYKADLPPLLFATMRGMMERHGGTSCAVLCHIPRAGITQEIVVEQAKRAGLAIANVPFKMGDVELAANNDVFTAEEFASARIYRLELPRGEESA